MYFQITWPRLWHENNIKREEENLHNGFGQLNIDKQKTFLCLRKPICRNRALNFKQRKYSVITTFARYSNTVIQFLKHITFTSHQMKSPYTKWRAGSSDPVFEVRQNFRKEQKVNNEIQGWQKSENLQKSWMLYGSPFLRADISNYSN